MRIYTLYEPLWNLLSEDASAKVRKDNYTRLFDEALRKVQAWEKASLGAKESPETGPHQDLAVPAAPGPGIKR